MPIAFEIQQGLPCVFTNLPNLVNIGHFFYKCLRPLDAHEIFRKEKRLFYFRIRTIFSRITPSIGPTFFTKLASIQYKLHTQLMFPYLNIF